MSRKRERVLERWLERDLTEAARAGELARAFEVDDLLEQLGDVLASSRHPVLIGESGVGKTALVHELVRRSLEPHGPPALLGRRVMQFSLRRRAAALKDFRELRPEVQELLEALLELGGEVVPFFPDLHIAHATGLEAQLEAFGHRFPHPVIAEGVAQHVRAMFEETPALNQRFVMLMVEEPTLPRAERILAAWADDQATLHGKSYSATAVEEALHLCYRFPAGGSLPRTALELLDQVGALKKPGEAASEGDVIDRFCKTRRVPRSLVDPAIALDLADLEARFSAQVLGQGEAVRAMVQMIGLIKAVLSDVRRPFGVFLFVGPTGVGKTHVAQLLAEYMFGGKERMVRFNMADYHDAEHAATLFGDPEHHDAAHRRGLLAQRIAPHSFAVLLLDEFEKAHARVHDRFLQLFDEGSFINGAGELVSCRSHVLIATSNAGADVYRSQKLGFATPSGEEAMLREVTRRLHEQFRFELLNRFDQIVNFRPLGREHVRAIALRELAALEQRSGLRRARRKLEIDEAVLDWLVVHGYDPLHGARFMRRAIERHVTTAIAELLVRARPAAGEAIALSVRSGRIGAHLLETEATPKPTPGKHAVVLRHGTTQKPRALDRAALLEEAGALIARAGPHLERLTAWRLEASELLQRMNEPGFWENRAVHEDVLERHRELEVAVRAGERLASAVEHLARARVDAERGMLKLEPLARALETGARALREWQDALAQGGATRVWMVIARADPLSAPAQWLEDLARMELAWSRRLGLTGELVAYELQTDALARVFLELEGPGAGTWLRMEAGVHRMARTRGGDLRAVVEVVAQSEHAPDPPPALTEFPRRAGLLDLDIRCSGKLHVPQRGLSLDLYGKDEDALGHLIRDLELAWQDLPSSPPDVARIYARDGIGGRDPRTGAIMPRLKDVLRGQLDPFLEVWREQQA